MIELAAAQGFVRDNVAPLEAVSVPLRESLGSVLAEGITATELVPPFDNTAMDGFAVRSVDVASPGATLRIVGTLAAGAAPTRSVGPLEAIRIMTGAPMPPDADAVAPVEICRVEADGSDGHDGGTVTIDGTVSPGEHVRPAGDDMEPGDLVLAAGTLMTPGALGLCATLGRSEVTVVRRPVVGVISTGDELVDGPGELGPGQIRDSNRITLLAMVGESGMDAIDLGLVRDDEALIEVALRDAVECCDAIVTSGGVSMGDFDYVKAVLDRIGNMRWMQVAIRPAKPLAFGTVARVDGAEVPVFGLPGNPVSSMVSYELFARPALRRMAGHDDDHLDRARLPAVVEGGLRRRSDGKIHFARVGLSMRRGELVASSAGGQGSHHTTAMAHADALAVLPDGDGFDDGDTVHVIPLRGL